jgi:plasmid stabilization system protein ParE
VRVVFTLRAERDLEEIADFIAQDSPRRAGSFVNELREKALSLADAPHAFRLVSRFEASGVRRRVHGRYLIFYRVEAEVVLVLHVLHGARDYEPLLFREQ